MNAHIHLVAHDRMPHHNSTISTNGNFSPNHLTHSAFWRTIPSAPLVAAPHPAPLAPHRSPRTAPLALALALAADQQPTVPADL
jgi:hypothetical protein